MIWIKKIKHIFGRHDYFVIKNFSFHCRKVGCKFCKKKWAMNDRTKSLLEWDSSFQELHGCE